MHLFGFYHSDLLYEEPLATEKWTIMQFHNPTAELGHFFPDILMGDGAMAPTGNHFYHGHLVDVRRVG